MSFSLRHLYNNILEYRGHGLAYELLPSVAPDVRSIMHRLERHKTYVEISKGDAEGTEDLWDLYALSRISDTLLWNFQPQEWQPVLPEVSLDQYREFFRASGLEPYDITRFHPFFHEIVGVETVEDPDNPAEITDFVWPGMRFGSMIFSRQGVMIKAGKNVIDKTIADKSTLFFTYRRKRPTLDLSHGWGSNSQWRTAFRRDYETADFYTYNAGHRVIDASQGLSDDDDFEQSGLSATQLIELIRFRQFVRTNKECNPEDLAPWWCTVVEPK
ncbi:MAG TPA: hypothetical protein V6C81_17395 [Planktothrix sp.]|jgi:hypothetical protein